MKYKYIRLFTGWLVLCTSVLLSGCITDEHTLFEQTNKETVSLRINMGVPGLSLTSTRAMTVQKETEIDYTTLQVLVFEETPSGERFRYKIAPEGSTSPFTVQVPVSSSGEKYRFVILANTSPQTIAENTLKEEALKQFVFQCAGKWNTSGSTARLIPMWGEQEESIVIRQNRSIHVSMHRALARVDIGNLFKFSNPNPADGSEYEQKDTDKESVWGLSNFKLKEVRVYRTEARAYAATAAEKMTGDEVVSPNLPSPRQFNADDGTPLTTLSDADRYPLLYTLPTSGSDSYIREIYVPESMDTSVGAEYDNVPCLVIGGYYGVGNTSKVTYYRADFAQYTNGIPSTYLSILRNHRYVFDIKSVNGPGFETPEQALRSISSRLELKVLDWNEVPQDYYVQGEYFFNLDTRNIVFDGRPQAGAQENAFVLHYNTNLELDGSEKKRITNSWLNTNDEEGYFFDISSIDYANKTITIKANFDNIETSDGLRTDTLYLQVENFKVPISVKQKEIYADYSLLCHKITVHGKYMEGVPLNYKNYITVKVWGDAAMIGRDHYEIKTLEKNGIVFKASGLFTAIDAVPVVANTYEYTIKLEGSGTPINQTSDPILKPFDVTVVTNSIDSDTCNTRIVLGYRTKKILSIGANAVYKYGYMLEPNSASRAFLDASINFGSDPNSKVSMEENAYGNAFNIEVMTVGNGMIGESIIYDSLKNKLNWFKPDIVLTGQAVNYFSSPQDRVINLLSDFVDAGGVFLMCNEYYPVSASIESMVKKIMGVGTSGLNRSIGTNQIFTINGAEDDPIVNGPFGDMRGKNWGADGHEMYVLSNLPSSETIIYSQQAPNQVNMFRHKTKPFFFMGEGGFLSNSHRYIGGAYQGSYVYFPFAIDHLYRPIPRTNFGLPGMNQTIHNSEIFGNIIAWAVDYAENNGIEYPESGNKFQ